MARIPLYSFGPGLKNMPAPSPKALGNKGAGLIKLAARGLPVPPGVIIPVEAFHRHREIRIGEGLTAADDWCLALATKVLALAKKHAGPKSTFSVRSGAPMSMPGMMDTVLGVAAKAEAIAEAIRHVYRSWHSDRAIEYRKQHDIGDLMGTAVIVQRMVYGTADKKSCTGVLFTRDPDTGENCVAGEFLVNALGSELVEGKRTPLPLEDMATWGNHGAALLDQLLEISAQVEADEGDAQDIEFTIERGQLYLLQMRRAKRTARAAFRIAKDMVDEGTLTQDQALTRVTVEHYRQLQRPTLPANFRVPPLAMGLAASTGVVVGRVVCEKEDLIPGEPYIFVAPETRPDDYPLIAGAAGVLTARGGITSHAAVVCRGMGMPAVVGLEKLGFEIEFAPPGKIVGVALGHTKIKIGERLMLDGATGAVWKGGTALTPAEVTREAQIMVRWATQRAQVFPWVDGSQEERIPAHGCVYLRPDLSGSTRAATVKLEQLLARPELGGVLGVYQPQWVSAEDAQYLTLLGASDPALAGLALPGTYADFLRVLSNVTVSRKALQRWQIDVVAEQETAQLAKPRLARWSKIDEVTVVEYESFLAEALGK